MLEPWVRFRFFLHLVLRAAFVRPGRAALQALALIAAAGAATALLNVYSDAEAKLLQQIATYGTNIMVEPLAGRALSASSLQVIDKIIGPSSIAAPLVLLDGILKGGGRVVVAATDFDRTRRLSEWWSVTGWPSRGGEALVGARSMPRPPAKNETLLLEIGGVRRPWRVAGVLTTGSVEDNRIYVAIEDLPGQTAAISAVLVGVAGKSEDIEKARSRIAASLPETEVRVLRQVATGSERVLKKSKHVLLAALTMVIITAALCIFAASSAAVFERRRDAAIMKALGASPTMVWALFVAEAAFIGAVASIPGFLLGIAAAGAISRVNFDAPLQVNWMLYPMVLAGCVAVVILSAAVPIELLRRINPAVHLKGE